MIYLVFDQSNKTMLKLYVKHFYSCHEFHNVHCTLHRTDVVGQHFCILIVIMCIHRYDRIGWRTRNTAALVMMVVHSGTNSC